MTGSPVPGQPAPQHSREGAKGRFICVCLLKNRAQPVFRRSQPAPLEPTGEGGNSQADFVGCFRNHQATQSPLPFTQVTITNSWSLTFETTLVPEPVNLALAAMGLLFEGCQAVLWWRGRNRSSED